MSNSSVAAEFYPNLVSLFSTKMMGSEEIIQATTDAGAASHDSRHFIDKAFLVDIYSSSVLETLVEPTPPCSLMTGTKKEGGERVIGMLPRRLHVRCLLEGSTWKELKLANVLVVDALPVPLHISTKALWKENIHFSVRSSDAIKAADFPTHYRHHIYWNNDEGYLGSVAAGLEQSGAWSQAIEDGATGLPNSVKVKAGICGSCGKKNVMNRCQYCKEMKYCNEECQEAHWQVHRNECNRNVDDV